MYIPRGTCGRECVRHDGVGNDGVGESGYIVSIVQRQRVSRYMIPGVHPWMIRDGHGKGGMMPAMNRQKTRLG